MEGGEDITNKTLSEEHLTSAVAFVEGGIQDACDDACSICLESFCQSDPSTLTSCKHEYHLQCILEWCQRSSQCPMCWQSISLKDPSSQELLEAVEQERNFRLKPTRNSTIFRHPTLGDFELQHLPMGVDNAEIEERIIQHLAAAAAMGRARHGVRREGHRNRTSNQSHHTVDESDTVTTNLPLPPHSPQQVLPSPSDQDRAGPSELQSFSESLKSKFNVVSTRYKESISKNTRNWKDKFFTRNASIADIGSEVKREVSAGIATVSRMMERLETNRANTASVSTESNNRSGTGGERDLSENDVKGTCATSSGSGSGSGSGSS